MLKYTFVAAVLLGACTIAPAQDIVLSGHVQRVVLEPSGTEHCPPPCPAVAKVHPDGTQTVCVSNMGGCQAMDVKIDHVFRGATNAVTRTFSARIGEFGPTFFATNKQIVVSEEGGKVQWSFATERDGKVFIDPKQLRSIGGVASAAKGDAELVSLDEVLARSSSR